jgi:hypothetical protein
VFERHGIDALVPRNGKQTVGLRVHQSSHLGRLSVSDSLLSIHFRVCGACADGKREEKHARVAVGQVMAINLQVECVGRDAGATPHSKILGIGGRYANGTSWYLSEAAAIERIQKDKWKFYVYVGDKRLKVRVAKRADGMCLRIDSGTAPAINLENLPTCPSPKEDMGSPDPA